jgi:hypothetical protein
MTGWHCYVPGEQRLDTVAYSVADLERSAQQLVARWGALVEGFAAGDVDVRVINMREKSRRSIAPKSSRYARRNNRAEMTL